VARSLASRTAGGLPVNLMSLLPLSDASARVQDDLIRVSFSTEKDDQELTAIDKMKLGEVGNTPSFAQDLQSSIDGDPIGSRGGMPLAPNPLVLSRDFKQPFKVWKTSYRLNHLASKGI
jgi:hypothetical protein